MIHGLKGAAWSQSDPPRPPQGEMATTPAGFAHLTHLLMGLAEGKLILSLEVSDITSSLSPTDPGGCESQAFRSGRSFCPSIST